MKVIHMVGYSTSRLGLGVDPLKFKNEWHIHTARQIQARTSKYQQECWQPERTLREVYVEEEDGITYRRFPSFYIPGWGIRSWEVSLPLLKELKKLRSEEVLITLHNPYNFMCQLIAYLNKVLPVLSISYGGRYLTLMRLLDWVDPVIKAAFKSIDTLMVCTEADRKYVVSRITGKKKAKDIQVSPFTPVDFDLFKPMDRREARQKLGLPQDKKLILYVGRLYQLKGVDVLLDLFRELKKKHDAELVMIGHWPQDPLLEEAKSAGARVIGLIPQEELRFYYSAADVYVLPMFDSRPMATGGIGAAIVECLACGTPVVSTSLRHFPRNELPKVGKIPQNPDDVIKCIAEILDDPGPYYNCREVARRYYHWDVIVNQVTQHYERLFEAYYGSQ